MLFHEINSAYFACVSAILKEAQQGALTWNRIEAIVAALGFGESSLTIPQKLKDGSWPFLDDELRTPIRHAPETPLTLLQKRWLKTLLLDPRIRLFGVPETGLEDVKPLFTPEMFVWYDRYTDGDPYTDVGYIERFRFLIQAIHAKKPVMICFEGGRGKRHSWIVFPWTLEYSLNDDKFRLVCNDKYSREYHINLSRINHCEETNRELTAEIKRPGENDTVILTLKDERNTLERFMLQFAYLQKETERMEDGLYKVTLYSRHEDIAELLIRLLSFGPTIKVESPKALADEMRNRVFRQINGNF